MSACHAEDTGSHFCMVQCVNLIFGVSSCDITGILPHTWSGLWRNGFSKTVHTASDGLPSPSVIITGLQLGKIQIRGFYWVINDREYIFGILKDSSIEISRYRINTVSISIQLFHIFGIEKKKVIIKNVFRAQCLVQNISWLCNPFNDFFNQSDCSTQSY